MSNLNDLGIEIECENCTYHCELSCKWKKNFEDFEPSYSALEARIRELQRHAEEHHAAIKRAEEALFASEDARDELQSENEVLVKCIKELERDPADADGAFESGMGRVAYGVANRVDRLKATGNGQVPIVVATAFGILKRKEESNER